MMTFRARLDSYSHERNTELLPAGLKMPRLNDDTFSSPSNKFIYSKTNSNIPHSLFHLLGDAGTEKIAESSVFDISLLCFDLLSAIIYRVRDIIFNFRFSRRLNFHLCKQPPLMLLMWGGVLVVLLSTECVTLKLSGGGVATKKKTRLTHYPLFVQSNWLKQNIQYLYGNPYL